MKKLLGHVMKKVGVGDMTITGHSGDKNDKREKANLKRYILPRDTKDRKLWRIMIANVLNRHSL